MVRKPRARTSRVLLVIAEPRLAAADRTWIETIRRRHDPNHRVVPPHFTLVFHAAMRQEAAVAAHVRRIAARFRRFACRLRCALTYPDSLSGQTYVSLMPDEGFAALVRLHDRLYTGPLKRQLRLDIPFTPHVTLARFATPAPAKRLADRINARDFAVRADVGAIDLVAYDGAAVTPLARIALR